MELKKQTIGITTKPIYNAGLVPLSNLATIFEHLFKEVYIITANKGSKLKSKAFISGISYQSGTNPLSKIINFIVFQMKICTRILRLKEVKVWVFFLDSYNYTLPVVVSKWLNKKVIFLLASSTLMSAHASNDVLGKVLHYSARPNFSLADKIIVYSKNLIEEWDLQKWNNKILVAHRHFLNFNNFKLMRPIKEREQIVGYIGRYSNEKGITNFIDAMQSLLDRDTNIKVILCGEGHLKDKIDNCISKASYSSRIKQHNWIPHYDLPFYLNKIKLLVIPSFSEGLPNIMLEAMACGTIILATSVGAIPDVIKDGKTGFILQDNSPGCIEESILRILDMPDDKLGKVSENARNFVEMEFNYNNVVEKWDSILSDFFKYNDFCS